MLESYLPILIFLIFAVTLAFILIGLPFALNQLRGYAKKSAPYECGFEEFALPRKRFDVRFYLVAILFIIFDLEIAFLFPWAVILQEIGWEGFFSMLFFLWILTVGFIYEWKKGALEWK